MVEYNTKEQQREIFLSQARQIAFYWANVKEHTDSEKINGAIFSILAMIDGVSSPFIPMFISFEEDGEPFNDDVYLHDMFYEKEN